jgi:uncharacterized membrane protein YgdD (TMEM256/DUF423 family)
MTARVLIALAGLMGSAGVLVAAASAHAAPGASLDSASSMLLFHAAAVVAIAAALDRGLVWRPLGVLAAIALVLGAGLFAGDLAMRAFAQARLFPMAAPTGGTLMIGGWLALAGSAVTSLRQR